MSILRHHQRLRFKLDELRSSTKHHRVMLKQRLCVFIGEEIYLTHWFNLLINIKVSSKKKIVLFSIKYIYSVGTTCIISNEICNLIHNFIYYHKIYLFNNVKYARYNYLKVHWLGIIYLFSSF